MKKMTLGYPLPEIKKLFDELFSNKNRESISKFDVPIGGKQELRNVFEVPLELPKYRLNNTRTISMQEQYIAENSLPKDFFDTDPLSEKLQTIQHEILKGLIDRAGLRSFFKDKSTRQTDPLILTNDGFVISGNRRLCAFRELYYNTDNGSVDYTHFERVRVVILPKLSEEQIEYIEDYFEQQPDIQDEFTWTNKALGFEKRLEKRGYSVNELAKRTNVKKADIESLLSRLSVAREYLEFTGSPSVYTLVDDDKYAFESILKSRKKFDDDPAQKDIFQNLSFLALKYQEKISDRMYKNIPVIQEVLEDIKREISTDFKDEIERENNLLEDFDPLGDLEEEVDLSHGILSLIGQEDYEEQIFEIILDKVNERNLQNQEKKRKQAVLKKIQKAHKELADAFNIINEETKKDGIDNQLKGIEKKVLQIRNWLVDD